METLYVREDTSSHTAFDLTPSPLNMTVEQQVAVFHCQHSSSDDIIWRVNGTSPNSPYIFIEGVPLSGGGYGSSLSIRTLLGFNRTTVECVAIFFDGSLFVQFTPPVTLLIQGKVTLALLNHGTITYMTHLY